MSVLRIRAFEILADCISEVVPELAGLICAGPADTNHRQSTPSLAINPVRYKYHPRQAEEWREISHSVVVMDVGSHETDVQMVLSAKTHKQRAILEEKILNVFLASPLRPGVLVTAVADCFDAHIAWELEDSEWEEEFVFDQKWRSIIHVTAQIPALVCRRDAYTIEQLQLGLSDDFSTVFDSSSFSTSPSVEVVQLNSDGTITSI